MIIFTNCKNNSAAKGDKSIPPMSGIIFLPIRSTGSVRLYKMDEVASKAPGFNQLNKALAKIAKMKILSSKLISSMIDKIVRAPMLIVTPLSIQMVKSASICRDTTRTSEDVSIFPMGGM